MDPELVELLKQLIAVPSVNPEDTDDPRIAGEGRLADFLAGYLEALGFRVAWDDKESGRPNLVAEHGPARPKSTILLEAHLDTVGVAGMPRPPFEAVIEGRRLYGRGACDDKGPMAAALHAMSKRTLHALGEHGVRVVFVGAMGEEKGNVGAERLARSDLRADRVIVLEPTELAIVLAHKGALWFKVEVGGVAAHGSNPGVGLNAITGMARVLDLLERQVAEDRARHRNAVLGEPTLNVGRIEGGCSVNIVPDRCVIHVDRRTLPEESTEEILERLRAGLVELQKNGVLASHAIRVGKIGSPFETSAQSGLVRLLEASCAASGVAAKREGAAWHSDAGHLSKIGSELVVFGPGSIRQAHTTEEYIDLDSLQAGCSILKHFFGKVVDDAKKSGDR